MDLMRKMVWNQVRREGRKGIELSRMPTLSQLGHKNCERSRARFNIVAEIAFPSKRKEIYRECGGHLNWATNGLRLGGEIKVEMVGG